jgi:hypothetical protein
VSLPVKPRTLRITTTCSWDAVEGYARKAGPTEAAVNRSKYDSAKVIIAVKIPVVTELSLRMFSTEAEITFSGHWAIRLYDVPIRILINDS